MRKNEITLVRKNESCWKFSKTFRNVTISTIKNSANMCNEIKMKILKLKNENEK